MPHRAARRARESSGLAKAGSQKHPRTDSKPATLLRGTSQHEASDRKHRNPSAVQTQGSSDAAPISLGVLDGASVRLDSEDEGEPTPERLLGLVVGRATLSSIPAFAPLRGRPSMAAVADPR